MNATPNVCVAPRRSQGSTWWYSERRLRSRCQSARHSSAARRPGGARREAPVQRADGLAEHAEERRAERRDREQEGGDEEEQQHELHADEREQHVPDVHGVLARVPEERRRRAPADREPERGEGDPDARECARDRAPGEEEAGLALAQRGEPAAEQLSTTFVAWRRSLQQRAVALLERALRRVPIAGELCLEIDEVGESHGG